MPLLRKSFRSSHKRDENTFFTNMGTKNKKKKSEIEYFTNLASREKKDRDDFKQYDPFNGLI